MNTRYQLEISKVFRTHVISGAADWVQVVRTNMYVG